jgi:hypothetical protein
LRGVFTQAGPNSDIAVASMLEWLVPAQATVSFVGLSIIRVRVSVLEVHIVFGKSSALVSNQAGCIQVAA